MGENIIKSICWDITSRCNDNCTFCYRNPNNKELDFESNKIILKKLIDFGVDKISFVGGEPLLYAKLYDLVRWGIMYAEGKTQFSITTNTILLTELIDEEISLNEREIKKILELFDWITFSLDAPNREIQNRMGRNKFHYERVIKILQYLNDSQFSKKIKINTVVSNLNKGYLIELYQMLCKYSIKRWKLFRFLPSRGNALKYQDKYYISETQFEDEIKKIKIKNKSDQILITTNGYENFDNSYITISSDGKLVVYNNGKYENKINLLYEDAEKILQYIDIKKHIEKRSDFIKIERIHEGQI